MFIKALKFYKKNIVALNKYLQNRSTDKAKLNLVAADLTRNTHSIEKGLSIDNPRPGFGHKKQKEMIEQLAVLSSSNSEYHKEVCAMAVDALMEYVEYHRNIGYDDDFISSMDQVIKKYKGMIGNKKKGGTCILVKDELRFNIPEIEYFFNSRHSIRDFEKTQINETNLMAALELAKRAPSACNRQGVRVYVLSPEKHQNFVNQLSGIGGFAEAVNKFIIITGKTSAYRLDENNQYIVSASMYAAYLTLTLHLYGIGACVVQRPVIWNNEWEDNKRTLGIESDEQIICLIAIGNLKDSCKVPLSHRFENSEMIRFL